MPLPRVRFTVRRLMVAVAVVAVLLGFYVLLEADPYLGMAFWMGLITFAPIAVFVFFLYLLSLRDPPPR